MTSSGTPVPQIVTGSIRAVITIQGGSMTIRNIILTFVFGFLALGAGSVWAEDDFGQEEAEEMAFQSLDAEEQKAVLATLQAALDESIGEAEEQIRERGSIVPYAYALNYQGQGQFLRVGQDRDVSAEHAAHGLQRAIVESAFSGNLVGSVLYMTMASPSDLGQMGREIEKEIDEDAKDVRLLAVEMQHLAGVGAVTFVPYWKSDDEWVFGKPQQRMVEPELRKLVRKHFEAHAGQ